MHTRMYVAISMCKIILNFFYKTLSGAKHRNQPWQNTSSWNTVVAHSSYVLSGEYTKHYHDNIVITCQKPLSSFFVIV